MGSSVRVALAASALAAGAILSTSVVPSTVASAADTKEFPFEGIIAGKARGKFSVSGDAHFPKYLKARITVGGKKIPLSLVLEWQSGDGTPAKPHTANFLVPNVQSDPQQVSGKVIFSSVPSASAPSRFRDDCRGWKCESGW